MAILGEVPYLSRLSEPERRSVALTLQERTYPLGASIVEEGDPADGLYIVASGRADVVDSDGDATHTYRAGECFGERSLLKTAVGLRAATVQAAEAGTKCHRLGVEEFRELPRSLI